MMTGAHGERLVKRLGAALSYARVTDERRQQRHERARDWEKRMRLDTTYLPPEL